MAYFSMVPTFNIIWLPLLIVKMILFASGIGLWLSALSIQYRDIRHAIQFISQLMMYAAPVVWPISLMTEKFGESLSFWYGLYPMVGVIEGFRASLIGNSNMPFEHIFLGFLSSVVILITGSIYFKKKEKIFADVA